MAIEKILVVDDEPLLRNFVRDTLRRMQKQVTTAENGQQAIELLQTQSFDLVITDMKMPYKTGIDVLKFAKSVDRNLLVVIITAYGSFETAIEAMQHGAFNYLIKPFSPDAIEALLAKAEEHLALLHENQYLKNEGSSKRSSSDVIAESPPMKKLLSEIDKIATSQASVFISGESGTGKEVIASQIHARSNRSEKPFVKVNCAAVPESLVESEFFGHEKGSFTGAHTKRIGKFELAHQGSLLLDEITEIPINLQPKLLRAVQEQEIERIGGSHPIKVDIRFIATSNRDMSKAIKEKVFREDLFYRLNVVPVHILPLRERQEDIGALSEYFLDRFCFENHKLSKKLSDEALEKLLEYPWPGNVRELANIIERTVVLHTDRIIQAQDLRLDPIAAREEKQPIVSTPSNMTLRELERLHILKTLADQNQNRTRTAKVLGISVRTLRNKIHEYNFK